MVREQHLLISLLHCIAYHLSRAASDFVHVLFYIYLYTRMYVEVG